MIITTTTHNFFFSSTLAYVALSFFLSRFKIYSGSLYKHCRESIRSSTLVSSLNCEIHGSESHRHSARVSGFQKYSFSLLSIYPQSYCVEKYVCMYVQSTTHNGELESILHPFSTFLSFQYPHFVFYTDETNGTFPKNLITHNTSILKMCRFLILIHPALMATLLCIPIVIIGNMHTSANVCESQSQCSRSVSSLYL